MLNIPHMSKTYPSAIDLHLLYPTCTLPLLDVAAARGEPCRGPVPQRCCVLAAGCVCLPVLLQAAACHLQCPACRSSHCGRVTPAWFKDRRKSQSVCQKLPFLRQEWADGWGQAGNKEKQWQYWSVRWCTLLHVVFGCLPHSVWGLWREGTFMQLA